jgi:branched-chain amino acid transport system substrate-binding protein
LTIYSSLPMQGENRVQSEHVVRGIRLVLDQVNGEVGRFKLKYVPLDDSTASTGKWAAEHESANARRAGADKSAIAYLGAFISGATAVSLPLLDESGLLQVSMSNTYIGLTRFEGAEEGEPEKYVPTG